MRTAINFFCAFFICTIVWGQQENSLSRDITLTVLNRRGRPVSNIIALSVRTGEGGITNRSGMIVFKDMLDSDSITIRLTRNNQFRFPVAGMDSIVVTANSSNLYSYIDNYGEDATTEITRSELSNATVLDVQGILSTSSYHSLFDLLQGNVSGIQISTGPITSSNFTTRTTMRGLNSFTGNSEPLVVLDGVAAGTLSTANSMVNLYDIKTIEIHKDGSAWGVRGANGVIVINSR